jgi:hypothetical protein
MKPRELAKSLGIQLWTPVYQRGKGVGMKQTDDGFYIDLGDLPRAVNAQLHSNPQGQGEALHELITAIKHVQDSLALAWSQTDPERPAANLREMVRRDEADLGALVDKAEALIRGQGDQLEGGDASETTPPRRTDAPLRPGLTRVAEPAVDVLGGGPEISGQGECDGSGKRKPTYLADMLEVWADWIRRGDPIEDTNANLCADDIERAAKVVRCQSQDQETPKLQELRLWVEAAKEEASNPREAKAFERVLERISSLRSFDAGPQGEEGR